jgi:hypothetical protein
VEKIGTQNPVYLFPCRVDTAKVEILSGISKDFDVCKKCALQIHDAINNFINLPENKKHPITFLIQKYKSVTQFKVKERIHDIINVNKGRSAEKESGGNPVSMERIPPPLWQQELHYFIVEKLLSIGICRMDVIFKAIKDGVLHVPLSYTTGNHKKHFIKTYILSLLVDCIDRQYVDFVVPARKTSAGTDAETINYNQGALVYTGFCSTLLSGMLLLSACYKLFNLF